VVKRLLASSVNLKKLLNQVVQGVENTPPDAVVPVVLVKPVAADVNALVAAPVDVSVQHALVVKGQKVAVQKDAVLVDVGVNIDF
jgi:hypothetical protein